jgi:hypothetical protein
LDRFHFEIVPCQLLVGDAPRCYLARQFAAEITPPEILDILVQPGKEEFLADVALRLVSQVIPRAIEVDMNIAWDLGSDRACRYLPERRCGMTDSSGKKADAKQRAEWHVSSCVVGLEQRSIGAA